MHLRFLLLVLGLVLAAPVRAQTAHGSLSTSERLRLAASGWHGTEYRFGGTRIGGIDCSALMVRWFDHLFGVALPRTSQEQFEAGRPVERARLAAGDLVFFGSPSRITHVGVYVGGGEFAHASSSSGVTISALEGDYWQRHWRGARRVLGPQHHAGGHRPAAPMLTLALPPRSRPAPDTSAARPRTASAASSAQAPSTWSGRAAERASAGRRIGW
jgi:hypothetical protein